jgi:4-diphosphocytidyl-2-C-methyl-D-erythritol kinase
MIWEPASAKINLSLHIVGKRANGYHLLDSLVVFAGIGDRLSAEWAETLALRVTGPFAAGLDGEQDNLVLRAARTLAEAAGIAPKAALVLEKNLPVASGIGGGSADAAAALRVLSRLWGIALAPEAMAATAARLGADVPVCLAGQSARMRGIGEQLDPAPRLPDCGLVLVNPGVAVSTADVFRARRSRFSLAAELPVGWANAGAMAHDLAGLTNDLQPPAVALCPRIGEALDVLAALPGCLLARMSGSGATCFGLFDGPEEAARAAASIDRSGWWAWGGGLSRA